MWGWVELTYRAFAFSPPQARPDTASTNRLPITLGVMDTEVSANTCSSCHFENTLDQGHVYLCHINNDCTKSARALYLDWLSRTYICNSFGRLFTLRLCGRAASSEDLVSTSTIYGQKREQNLQYGLLTRIGISLNGQQVRACSSNLL